MTERDVINRQLEQKNQELRVYCFDVALKFPHQGNLMTVLENAKKVETYILNGSYGEYVAPIGEEGKPPIKLDKETLRDVLTQTATGEYGDPIVNKLLAPVGKADISPQEVVEKYTKMIDKDRAEMRYEQSVIAEEFVNKILLKE